MSKNEARIPGLDGLRAIAILWVILFHSYLIIPAPPAGLRHSFLGSLALSGFLGVDLFFVLSGFLITGILFDSKNAPRRFLTFYARRTLRIFPLYYAFLGVASLLPLFVSSAIGPSWYNWFYLSNFGGYLGLPLSHVAYNPLWSLAIEEQFYLMWPWLIFGLSRKSAMRACVGLLILSSSARVILNQLGLRDLMYSITPVHLDGLVIGSWIALALRGKTESKRLIVRSGLALSVVVLLVFGMWRRGITFDDKNGVALGILLFSLFAGAVVAEFAEKSTPGLLSRQPLRSVGTYSYAMYLFHWPILLGLSRAGFIDWRGQFGYTDRDLIVIFVATCLISFTSAFMTWHLFERRFLALKNRFQVGPEQHRRLVTTDS